MIDVTIIAPRNQNELGLLLAQVYGLKEKDRAESKSVRPARRIFRQGLLVGDASCGARADRLINAVFVAAFLHDDIGLGFIDIKPEDLGA
jgi:hypothetical protein